MTETTSREIGEKIAGLDRLVTSLGLEFDDVAVNAVAGVPDAARKAAEINQRLERLGVDRRILSRALDRARQVEIADREAKAEAERQRHFDAAKDHAKRLLGAAHRVDAAIAEFAAALPELSEHELAIRQRLGRAQISLSVGVVGQMGLTVMAMDKLSRLADGRSRLSGPSKSIAEIAASAWAILLADKDEQGSV
ncbi:hypothetical protein [Mesorhizobium sp. M0036]|uniref:hypothetical protein n=1 Tax=Mesorhizobium sp. M0036 TaxID=2956853 RepID=UPI00333BF333